MIQTAALPPGRRSDSPPLAQNPRSVALLRFTPLYERASFVGEAKTGGIIPGARAGNAFCCVG